MKKLRNHKPLTKEEIRAFQERVKQGVEKSALTMLSYEPCTGCDQTTGNGGCFMVDGKCVWIPEIG